MWDNQGYEADLGDNNYSKKRPLTTRTTEINNYDDNMRGFGNVSTKTPLPEDEEEEDDPDNPKKKSCFRRFCTLMLSHFGTFFIVILYLVMGGFLFTYLEFDNEKASCIEKYDKYVDKLAESVDRVYNIAQGGNVSQSKTAIEQELSSFSIDLYSLSVDPEKNCTTVGEAGNEAAWNIINSAYFCATIVTTIGYGHISPTTKWGQIVCMIYSILGIPIMLLFLSKIGEPTAMVFRSFYLNICCCKCFLSSKKLRKQEEDETDAGQTNWKAVEDGKGEPGSQPPPKVGEVTVIEDEEEDDDDEIVSIPITVTLIVLVAYIGIGAGVFVIWEKEWTMVEGMYFSFITLTTVGFGDYVPGRNGPFGDINIQIELIVALIYCIFGLTLLSMCMNLIQDEIAAKFTWIGRKIGVITAPKKEDDEVEEYHESSSSSSESSCSDSDNDNDNDRKTTGKSSSRGKSGRTTAKSGRTTAKSGHTTRPSTTRSNGKLHVDTDNGDSHV